MFLVSTVAIRIARRYHRIPKGSCQVAPLRVDILGKCISLITIHLKGSTLQGRVQSNLFTAETTLSICSL